MSLQKRCYYLFPNGPSSGLKTQDKAKAVLGRETNIWNSKEKIDLDKQACDHSNNTTHQIMCATISMLSTVCMLINPTWDNERMKTYPGIYNQVVTFTLFCREAAGLNQFYSSEVSL